MTTKGGGGGDDDERRRRTINRQRQHVFFGCLSKVDCFSFLMVGAFVFKKNNLRHLVFWNPPSQVATFVFKHNNNQPSTCLFWMPVNVPLHFNFNIAGFFLF